MIHEVINGRTFGIKVIFGFFYLNEVCMEVMHYIGAAQVNF